MTQTREERRAYVRVYKESHRGELRTASRIYREAHREERLVYDRAYYKAHREEIKAAVRARQNAHREERNAYVRAYREVRRKHINILQRALQHANPQKAAERARRRRALKRGATIGKIDLAAIRQRDQMRCCICGKKVFKKPKDPMMRLSFDHSHPLSLGGPHSQENLRVAHRRCNSRRGPGRLPVQLVLV